MFKSLTGMPDILPEEMERWHAMEEKLRRILKTFAFREIRTPLLEPTELFARSIGASTDVVEKEMYSFADRDKASITLRPEGTASVVRAYLEHHLDHGNEVSKLYYMGPMFRHERPQKGRLRQFYQMGVEVLGSDSPSADAEVIALGFTLMSQFQVPEARLELNSVGDAECRPKYRAKLQAFLRDRTKSLCENCQRRIETNPLRVFDCKVESCKQTLKDAPMMLDHLCANCKTHFEQVQSNLKRIQVPFHVNPRIVRGLDYYSRTAFEIEAGGLGSQNSVLAGGRYDGLAKEIGGKEVPAVGFAMGLERLLLSSQEDQPQEKKRVEFIPLDLEAQNTTLKLTHDYRLANVAASSSQMTETPFTAQSIKGALRRADKNGTQYVVLIGSNEIKEKSATVKNLQDGGQEKVPFGDLSKYLQDKTK